MKLFPEILTHPNIPKPLHGINPRSIKGAAWWGVIRQEVYKSTDYHCIACGVHKSDALFHNWLEAHESYTINYETGEVKIIEIVPLCHACHNFIHSGLLLTNYQKGNVSKEKFKSIMQHGCNILYSNNLKISVQNYEYAEKLECENIPQKEDLKYRKIAEWEKWHLLFEGVKYYSKFKSYVDWVQFYRNK